MTDYMLHRVTSFLCVRDYVLKMTFEDGLERTIDFEPILIGPIFGALRDRKLFKQVTLNQDFGALEWPNGADIEPTVLYDWPDHVDAIVERRLQIVAVPVC